MLSKTINEIYSCIQGHRSAHTAAKARLELILLALMINASTEKSLGKYKFVKSIW